MNSKDQLRNAELERAETLAINEACNQFLDTLHARLGDRMLVALANTEHVHSRAIVACREGSAGEVTLDAVLSGNVPTTRVVLPVRIEIRFGRERGMTAEELVEYMAAAKANARVGKEPDPL